MKPRIDFQLCEVFSSGKVTGRNCGADAPVGTIFSGLYLRDYSVCEPELSSAVLLYVCDISLRLDAVEMFLRRCDLVAAGFTALLHLSGDGFAIVADCLRSAPSRTYYSLCAFD